MLRYAIINYDVWVCDTYGIKTVNIYWLCQIRERQSSISNCLWVFYLAQPKTQVSHVFLVVIFDSEASPVPLFLCRLRVELSASVELTKKKKKKK